MDLVGKGRTFPEWLVMVPSQARRWRVGLEGDQTVPLVLIGVRGDGRKELITLDDGYR